MAYPIEPFTVPKSFCPLKTDFGLIKESIDSMSDNVLEYKNLKKIAMLNGFITVQRNYLSVIIILTTILLVLVSEMLLI